MPPILPLEKGQDDDAMLLRVLAVMLYPQGTPQEETARQRFIDKLLALHLSNRDLPTVPGSILRNLTRAPTAQETDTALTQRMFQGRVTGHILFTVWLLYKHDPVQQASLNKARYYVKQFYAFCRQHGIDTEGRGGTQESTLKKVWAAFKSVAHLWAAHYLTLYSEGSSLVFTSGYLPILLERAECFRRFGTQYVSSHQSQRSASPILLAEETWTVPEGYLVPNGELSLPDSVEELTLMRYFLEDYRAPTTKFFTET